MGAQLRGRRYRYDRPAHNSPFGLYHLVPSGLFPSKLFSCSFPVGVNVRMNPAASFKSRSLVRIMYADCVSIKFMVGQLMISFLFRCQMPSVFVTASPAVNSAPKTALPFVRPTRTPSGPEFRPPNLPIPGGGRAGNSPT